MQTIITVDNIARYRRGNTICIPERAIVTSDARAWARGKGLALQVQKMDRPSREQPPLTLAKENLETPEEENTPVRVVVSVVGRDKVGIIAGVSQVLAQHNVNILDISQTTMQDLFAMIMLVDIAGCSESFETLKKKLENRGDELGVDIKAQREEIFKYMHRI